MKNFFWRWQFRLPSPFTASEHRAGYVYDLAFRQFEVSDTRVFTHPQAGRAFFEGLIRDHLDIGRPSKVVLLFDKKLTARTPGHFSTKVVTRGVDPQISCVYKASRIKQYFKEHKALRTETVICDTKDFGIGRRVNSHNWQALRAVGENANRRLCDAQAIDAQPAPDVVTFQQVTQPSVTHDGLQAPSLRFGDPRVMAVLAALLGFCLSWRASPTSSSPTSRDRSWMLPTPIVRRPTTSGGSAAKGSFVACRAHSATNSPRLVGAWPSCSPKRTDGCSLRGWPCSISPSTPRAPLTVRSILPGAASTAPLIPSWTAR